MVADNDRELPTATWADAERALTARSAWPLALTTTAWPGEQLLPPSDSPLTVSTQTP